MSEKSFKKQISETILHLLQKETFSNHDQLKLAECQKLLKKINKRKDSLIINKHIESERTARFNQALKLLLESGALTGLIDILRKSFEKNTFDFDNLKFEKPVEFKNSTPNEENNDLEEINRRIEKEPLLYLCEVLKNSLTEKQITEITNIMGDFLEFKNLLNQETEEDARIALSKLKSLPEDIKGKFKSILALLDDKQKLCFNAILAP